MMKRSGIWLIGLCMLAASGQAQETRLHAKMRDTFYPGAATVVRANPVPFLWPSRGHTAEYRFRLGRTPDFSDPSAYTTNVQWACFYPERKLTPGTWYWQIDDQPVQHFEMPATVAFSLELPPFDTLLARLPTDHPRLLLRPGEQTAFAARMSPELRQEVLTNADQFLQFIPTVDRLKDAGASATEDQKAQLESMRQLNALQQTYVPVLYLAEAWLLTGDERYGRKSAALAMDFVRSSANAKFSDFAEALAQNLLVLAYDSCYSLLTPADRTLMEQRIGAMAENMFRENCGLLEAHVFENHTWQINYISFLKSALALYGHDERAARWLHYASQAWFSRMPATGFVYDGSPWQNGSGYMTASIVTLLQGPLLWERLAGIEAFDHPWFRQAARAIPYYYPPASYSDGFGDGHDSLTHPHWQRGCFMALLAKEFNDPVASWYVQELNRWPNGQKPRTYNPGAKHKLDSDALEWFVTLCDKPMPAPKAPTDQAQALAMPDGGLVSIHSNLAVVSNDVHVAFYSSPFGSGSHALASQNAFNIIAGGRPLFLSSGYYSSFSDPHTLLHYRHTRGHNTILVDGIGQSIGDEGYGQIRRFMTSADLSYAQGDASHAYTGALTDPMWINNMKKAGVEHSRSNGFGNAGLTGYQRHLVFIHPLQTLVIYDDLAADHPAVWNWLLHSPSAMQSLPEEQGFQRFSSDNGLFAGNVWLRGSTPLQSAISTKFFSPAINFLKATDRNGKVRDYPDQWHLSADSKPAAAMRYLAVIQMSPAGAAPLPVVWSNGVARIGSYAIRAELDAQKPAALEVSCAGTNRFSLASPQIQVMPLFPSR